MKRSLKVLSAALVGVAWGGVLFAGDVTYNFDTSPDPLTNPQYTNALIVGSHSYPSSSDPHWQVWSSGAGAPVGGNPGGYLSIADATNGGNGLAFVFPDIDNGFPLKGFKFDMDIRAGNGTLGRPADGFSISFARAGDPVLVNASNGTFNGFAGGDSLAAAQAAAGSGDAENGTKTGVAVVFDAWQGNYLPDTPPADGVAGDSNDREGIAVRLDDVTFIQLNLINNRNAADCVPTPQTTLTNNGSGLSCQTGTNALVVSGSGCSRVYGNTDTSGTYANLVWQPLHVQLVPTTTNTYNLFVSYKGTTVINANLPTYSAFNGRLVLAGRTGGNNQNCHVDNIHLVTLPATNAVLTSVQGTFDGFTFTISDAGASTLSAVTNVTLDGVNVLPQTQISYSSTNGQAPFSFGVYTQAVKLAPGTTHTVSLVWLDSFGVNSFGNFTFTVPNWIEFPPGQALPFSAVDQSKPGMLILPYQTMEYNPNQVRWTEEMVAGLHGKNVVGAPQNGIGPDASGALIWDGAIDFANLGASAPASVGNGFFVNDPNSSFANFGIGDPIKYPADNLHGYSDACALEMFSYVYFPTSGVYNMVIGSDDGYELTTSGNPRDRMGTILSSLNGASLPTTQLTAAQIHPVIIDAPGVYPIRILYENNTGGAGFEWYSAPPAGVSPVAGVNCFLVNDTNNTASGNSLMAFRALTAGHTLPPYVQRAVPVRDAMDVFYNQKILVDLADGTGLTVNSGTVALTVDGTVVPTTASSSAGVTHVTTTGTPNWTVGLHTNVLTFQDNLSGNYSYTWTFTVMGGINGVAAADPTNTPVKIPLTSMVSPGTLSNPGFIINSHQMMFKEPNVSGTAELELENLLGPNIATTFGTNGFYLDTMADFRFASGTGTGAGGQWAYDNKMSQFGFISMPVLNSGQNNVDNSALEIMAYVTFPAAGTYLFQFSSDDGFRMESPNSGNLLDKIGTQLGVANVGRGIAGPPGGVPNGGTVFSVNIPAAGAYPFRAVWENGGGDAALEWSVWVPQADGSYIEELVNDQNAPVVLRAYQNSSVASGPWVSYVNPAPEQQGVAWFAPTVVKITDGPTLTTDPTRIDSLTEDGIAATFTVPPKAGNVTTVVQQMTRPHPPGLTHTNVLVYHDNNGKSYTNKWTYSTFGTGQGSDGSTPNVLAPYALVTVPASLSVPIASLDLTQPGFRIKSYQTTAGNNNTVAWTEQQFMGLQGPNIADQSGAPNGFFTWTNLIDFSITPAGGANSSSAEWNYDLPLTNSLGNYFDNTLSPILFGNQVLPPTSFGLGTNPPGTTIQMNNCSLMIGAYLVFNRPGTYIMAVPSDDCFKITVPYGDPFNMTGLLIGDCNAGRGSSGAGFGSRGGMTFCPFVITNAGAYPFRMLWENGGGGGGVEWSIFQSLSDGSVAYVPINDPNNPDSIKAFQVTTNQPPYVAFMNLTPPLNYGPQRPDWALSVNNTAASTVTNNGSISQDFIFGLTNYQTGVNTNAPMSLTFRGVPQPFTLSVSNGLLIVTRPANNPQWWPSGALGPLVFNYQTTDGQNISQLLGNIQTPFWGTLSTPITNAVDPNSRGLKMRTYAIDDFGIKGLDNRIYQAEQVMAGLWGPNVDNPANYPTNTQVAGYWVYPGTDPSNTNGGVFNFAFLNGPDGDFRPTAFPEHPWPGIPSLATVNKQNNFVGEFLAYVTFPSNGVYTLGVASDDGFRLTSNWTPPAQNGSVQINSPASLAGQVAAGQDMTFASYILTNSITADLAVAYGPYTTSTNTPYAPPNEFGSTNFQGLGYSVDGCVINNDNTLAGKVALIFRSPYCGFAQKVANAQAHGAVGVILVDYQWAFTNGSPSRLPLEPTVNTPPLNIPILDVEWQTGLALLAAAQTNAPNVTLNPLHDVVNPPANSDVLGQVDIGKGASDVLFPVVVQQAGTYPLRLTWFQGGGGASCEFFSVVNGTRVLVNDTVNGSPLQAYYALATAVGPKLSIVPNTDGSITITFEGTLQSETDLNSHSWSSMAVTSPYTFTPAKNAAPIYYRAKQ